MILINIILKFKIIPCNVEVLLVCAQGKLKVASPRAATSL